MNDFELNHNDSETLLPPMLAEFRDALKDEELETIIKTDIKYRMGKELLEGGA